MKTRFVEATNQPGMNWGKFMVGRFDEEEWARLSIIDPGQFLLAGRGRSRDHVVVFDLETGQGAMFRPNTSAAAPAARNDLDKTRIWVCPLFEPFLIDLYKRSPVDLDALPSHVSLTARSQGQGYRRPGIDTNALVIWIDHQLDEILQEPSTWSGPGSLWATTMTLLQVRQMVLFPEEYISIRAEYFVFQRQLTDSKGPIWEQWAHELEDPADATALLAGILADFRATITDPRKQR